VNEQDSPLGDDPPETDGVGEEEETLEIPITSVLDLHTFRPREVPDVVRDYLDEAFRRGIFELRIIHGKGIGQQRRAVRTILERDPRVTEFGDAPGGAGGWGATCVTLREE